MDELLKRAHNTLNHGFSSLPHFDTSYDLQAIDEVLQQMATRMHNNYPYHHPLYVGQMLKPPHPVARLAYSMAMEINPNNHALDGGRESSKMEKEAVNEIAKMVGFDSHLGHLTGGGTMANFEALWVASQRKPNQAIAASANAHYTHSRLAKVLNVPFVEVGVTDQGKMDLIDLEQKLKLVHIGTVVVTLGTTGSGALDPLREVLALQEDYHFRIHVDAAYGGYFNLAPTLGLDAQREFSAVKQVDSFVIDPHKHGLQPYGCGCVLFKNPDDGRFYKHDSPYTYFTGDELHLGEISLECSRPGAAAVALRATQALLPYDQGGTFAEMLNMCLQTARWFYQKFEEDSRFKTVIEPELDIVLWALKGESLADVSLKSQDFFNACAEQDLHLALIKMPANQLPKSWHGVLQNQKEVTLLRSCMMKPEHWDWKDRIWAIMDDVAKTF